jgi:hypothetical protein
MLDVLITSGESQYQNLTLFGFTGSVSGTNCLPGHRNSVRSPSFICVAICSSRPGGGRVALFGLPGNLGAAAACFKFLVIPYLQCILGQKLDGPVMARLARSKSGGWSGKRHNKGFDDFRSGILHVTEGGETVVYDTTTCTGRAKLSPFISSNCWIHLLRAPGDQRSNGSITCYAKIGDVNC